MYHKSERTDLAFYWLEGSISNGSDIVKGARLLLVEDDQDNRDVLTFILSENYQVSSYGCAAEALAALEAADPDLVVLDIGMCPVDGLECLKAIRAVPGYDNIPAIALTGFAREVDRETFLAAGFQAVVTKPILEHQELFGAVASLLTSTPAKSHDPAAVSEASPI